MMEEDPYAISRISRYDCRLIRDLIDAARVTCDGKEVFDKLYVSTDQV